LEVSLYLDNQRRALSGKRPIDDLLRLAVIFSLALNVPKEIHSSTTNRLLKKTHLLCCARSPRSNVLASTPPLVDFSRDSQLNLFDQPVKKGFSTLC
jgi:hypothetical protein